MYSVLTTLLQNLAVYPRKKSIRKHDLVDIYDFDEIDCHKPKNQYFPFLGAQVVNTYSRCILFMADPEFKVFLCNRIRGSQFLGH